MQLKKQKLATIINVINKSIKVDLKLVKEVVLVQVKNNLKKKKRQLKTLKKKYLNVIKKTTNLKAVFNKIIKQLVTIKL